MKKTLLTAALAISLCAPTYALEQYNPNADEDTKIAYPVFGDEDQTQANMGNHTLEDEENQNTEVGKSRKTDKAEQNQQEPKEAPKKVAAKANENVDDDVELSTGRVTQRAAERIIAQSDPDYVPPYNYEASMSKEDQDLVNAVNAADQDAAQKKRKKDTTPDYSSFPVYLNGDHVEFENASGDFLATGHVKMSQGPEVVLTNYAFGNMKTGDIYLLEGGTLLEPGTRVEGKWVHYNYNTKTGELKQMKGRGKKDFFKAPHAFVMPDKLVADQGGTTTKCTAQKHAPCMHVEAKVIEFYPKEKMVAREAKIYIAGKHVYSRKLWVNEFGKDTNYWRPSIGYDSKDNGWFLRAEGDVNFSDKDDLHVNWTHYSHAGFKPMYQFTHNERNWKVSLKDGWEYSSDVWYKKERTWRLDYKPHYFTKKLPLTYSLYFEYGLWRSEDMDNHIETDPVWHRDYGFYINHDPIRLFGPDTTLHLTYGRKWVYESNASDAEISTNMYYTTIRQKVDSNKRIWVSYLRENRNSSMLDIDQADMSRELRFGIQWQPGRNDILSLVDRYNLGNPEDAKSYAPGIATNQYETTFNWYHRFCCWALQWSYTRQWYKGDHKMNIQYFFYNW